MQTQQTLSIVKTLGLELSESHILEILNNNRDQLKNVHYPYIQNECEVLEEEVNETGNGVEDVRMLILINRHVAATHVFKIEPKDAEGLDDGLSAVAHVSCSFKIWADVVRNPETGRISSIWLDRELLADMGAFDPIFKVNGVETQNTAITEVLDQLLLNIDHADIIQALLQQRIVDIQDMPYDYLVLAICKIDGVQFEDLFRVHSPVKLQPDDERLYKSLAYNGLYGTCQDFDQHFDYEKQCFTTSFNELQLDTSMIIDFDMGISVVRLMLEEYNKSLWAEKFTMHHVLILDDQQEYAKAG